MRALSELKITHDQSFPLKAKERAILQFEAAFEVVLPDDYKKFLKTFNGGEPNICRFKFSTNDESWVNAFFGLGRSRKQPPPESLDWDFNNLWDETHIARRNIGSPIIPFAIDPMGDYLVLDCRKPRGPVFLALHENRYKLIRLAQSFSIFIDNLY